MIIGILGMFLLFISLLAGTRKQLHIFQALSNIFLMAYAISIQNILFTVMNGVLLIVNLIQYTQIKKGVIKNG